MSRSSGRNGLSLVILVLAILVVAVDLMRPDSFILGAWRGATPRQTPVERLMNEFKRTKQVPLPRSNRVVAPDSRNVIPATQAPTGA